MVGPPIARAANWRRGKDKREAAGVLSAAQRHTHLLDSPRMTGRALSVHHRENALNRREESARVQNAVELLTLLTLEECHRPLRRQLDPPSPFQMS